MFSLSPKTNTSEILNRGFIIEAVAVKDNQMWSTVRDENIMLKWNLPLSNISKRDSVKLSNIPVGVKDMAYNNSEKVFYLLYSDNDYNNSKVLIMDTLGFKIGELDLPIKSISGIAMSPWGLNLITPGSNPTIYLVDKTGKLISQKIVEKVLGNDRRSLEFDESGFIQGVLNRDTNEQFRSEIQRIKLNVNYSNDSLVTLISSGINSIEFYGLTYYNGGIDRTKSQYICTDTAGVVRILPQFQFLNSVNDFKQLENNLNYKVYPNPAKNIINISLNSKDSNISDNCNLIIYNPQGDIIKEMKLKNVDKVNSSYEIDTKEFSSGLYYFVVTSTNGIRLSSPITIIK
ncbi:MAG: T9SS type A sorting domain-containing protein [Chlorobi bacterium]|nr:T9SS type A sorting domain-containing protein [Chlorobiota bacterium]